MWVENVLWICFGLAWFVPVILWELGFIES